MITVKKVSLCILLLTTVSLVIAQTHSRDSIERGVILPFTFAEISGQRPIIEYSINNKTATSMIHSNARSYLQLSLDNAEYFGVKDLVEAGKYGISEPGKTNTRYKGVVNEIRMGNIILRNKEVSVFNKYPPDTKGFGMLGNYWINDNRIILDFSNKKVIVQPDKFQQDSVAKQLRKTRYRVLPMELNKSNMTYYVEVEVNRQKTKFVVSTVAGIFIDSGYAKLANIATGDSAGSFAGPTGHTGNTFRSQKFSISIGKFKSTTSGFIEDEYNYIGAKRPEDANELIGGTLGADFMIINNAVIDFGNLVLYLKSD